MKTKFTQKTKVKIFSEPESKVDCGLRTLQDKINEWLSEHKNGIEEYMIKTTASCVYIFYKEYPQSYFLEKKGNLK